MYLDTGNLTDWREVIGQYLGAAVITGFTGSQPHSGHFAGNSTAARVTRPSAAPLPGSPMTT